MENPQPQRFKILLPLDIVIRFIHPDRLVCHRNPAILLASVMRNLHPDWPGIQTPHWVHSAAEHPFL